MDLLGCFVCFPEQQTPVSTSFKNGTGKNLTTCIIVSEGSCILFAQTNMQCVSEILSFTASKTPEWYGYQ